MANTDPFYPSKPDKSLMESPQQHEQQLANTAMSQGTAASLQPLALEEFTADEIDIAEFLVGMSKSITSMGERDASEASVALGSASPRLVNAQPLARELVLPRNSGADGDGDQEEDKKEVSRSQRRPKHYRSIAEIYSVTDQSVRYNLKNKKE